MPILVSMYQHQGKREYQQDAMARKSLGLAGTVCILADGMGGYKGGEIASKIITDTFMKISIDSDDIGSILKKYLYIANEDIAKYKASNPDVSQMGSTLVTLFITDNYFRWLSVGDSPLYFIKDDIIKRVNKNHSVAGYLEVQLANKEITQNDFNNNPHKHMLTSAITGEDIPEIDLSKEYPMKDDYIIILASDGIETLSPDEIKSIVNNHVVNFTQDELNEASKALVDAVISKKKPNQDNVSVIIACKERKNSVDSITQNFKRPIKKNVKKSKIENINYLKLILSILIILFMSILGWFLLNYNPNSKTLETNSTQKQSAKEQKSNQQKTKEHTTKKQKTKEQPTKEHTTKEQKTKEQPTKEQVSSKKDSAQMY